MSRLRSALKTKFAERKNDVQIYTPRNVETVRLKFRGERMAKVRTYLFSVAQSRQKLTPSVTAFDDQALGSLALTTPAPATPVSGLLVSKDFSYTLLSPADLREFTGLSTSIILQRQRLALSVSWDLVRWHLQGMYGKIAEGRDAEGTPTMRIMETVDVKHVDKHALAIEWVGGVTNDMIADSVLAVVLGIDGSPASVKSEWSLTGSSHITPRRLTPVLILAETTEDHPHQHHHHHHRHPYAEPPSPPRHTRSIEASASSDGVKKEEEEGTEAEASTLPSRLDRLIAFLDSYFGHVELLSPEEQAALPPTTPVWSATEVEEAAVKVEASSTEPAEKVEDAAEAILEKKVLERPLAPIVRVRLDDHWADVRIEDLVRSLAALSDSSHLLTTSPAERPSLPTGNLCSGESSPSSRLRWRS